MALSELHYITSKGICIRASVMRPFEQISNDVRQCRREKFSGLWIILRGKETEPSFIIELENVKRTNIILKTSF